MTAENSQRALARPHFSSGVHWPLGCPLGLFIGRSPVRNFHRAAGRRPLGILIGRTTDQKSQRASSSFFTARSAGASSGARPLRYLSGHSQARWDISSGTRPFRCPSGQKAALHPCFTIVEIEHVLPGELETESETVTVTVTVTDTETKQPTMYPNPAPGSDDKDPKEDQDPSKEVSVQAGKSCEGPKVDKWTLGEGPEWRERKDKINPKSGPILMSEIEGWSDEFTQNRSWTKCLGYSHKLFDQPSNRLYGKFTEGSHPT